MSQFRKLPVVIEAVQFTEREARSGWPHTIPDWLDEAFGEGVVSNCGKINPDKSGPRFIDCHMQIVTLEGKMRANIGDWIIRGVNGEIYPCKPDIFAKTYEPVQAPASPNTGETR